MKKIYDIMCKVSLLAMLLVFTGLPASVFAKDKNEQKTPKISYKVTINYPVVESEPLLNAQLAQIVQQKLQDFNKMFFVAETPAYPYGLELSIDSDSIYEDTAYISFFLTIYQYTGGAHGTTTLIPVTYSKQTKKLLSLEELVKPTRKDWLSALSTEARKQLSAQVKKGKLTSSDDCITQGTEPTQENFDLFKLEKNSVRFVFEQYQVAPYASGMPEIVVPLTLFK